MEMILHTYTANVVQDELLSCCFLGELEQVDL